MALLCSYNIASATNYYFSSSTGDDSRTTAQAQNPATPWKTISKLNSFSGNLNAGDNIFLQRGDVFYGTISINKSGASNNPITVSAYGTGADPLVTGFSSISSWTNLGGNIWESTSAVTTLSECNIISLNGVNTAYGRMPKTGYRTIQNASTTSITDNTYLNAGTQNWTGANVVTKVYRWHIARALITSASGSTINFSGGVEPDSPPQGGWGYYIQNHPSCLTQQNDWCFIPASKKIRIYSTSQPVNVKVPSIDNGAFMNFDNITFDNIDFTGFNLNGIELNGKSNITAQNCNFSFIALGGIYNDIGSGGDLTVSNCTFTECNAYGVRVRRMTNTIVENSVFDKIGNLVGMAGHQNTVGSGLYTGIQMSNGQALYNRLTNCGYNGITWNGSGTLIQGNFVSTFNYIKDDGGGIYTFPLGGESPVETYAQRRIVRDNTCINPVGNGEGTPNPERNESAAIYNDGNSAEVDYINNTMSGGFYGLYFHGGSNCTITGNTIYNATRGLYLVKYTTVDINNNNISNNVFSAINGGGCQDGEYTAYYERDGGLPASLTLSNNIYGRPLDQTNGWIWYDFNGSNVCQTLAQWKATTGRDAGSTQSPITVSDASKMRLEYNETSVPKTISLGATYIDMRSVTYAGSITLQPYTSAVLLKTGTGNVTPVANAGPDQTITLPTNNVNLSGSGTDPDGTISAFLWRKISGPASFTITNTSNAITTATGLTAGIYTFEIRVTDNGGATDTDTMQVTVNAAINQSPTSNAGSDQTITLPTNNTSLSGIGSDPDGTITSYQWTKLSGPANGTIANSTFATTSVTNLVQGVYQFELRVTDNNGATGTDIVQVTVNIVTNQLPTANAGLNQNITLPVSSVSLNGSGTDPDGTVSAFLWRKISGPTTFTITNTTSATTLVTNLAQGVYQFELRVTDNSGATDTDTMQVTVNPAVNQAPTANAGLNQNITLPVNTVSLNGSGSDPDGNISAFLWRKISGPTTFTITNTTAATTSVTNLTQGVYQFELRVTDNSGATDTDTLQVTVNPAANQVPTANAGLDQSITLPVNTITLSGSGTDPDGTIASYSWVKISGPASGTITNASNATTTVTGLVQGLYQFQLTVTDNNGATDTDVMQVNVNPVPNQSPTAIAGLDQNITLPVNTVSLNGIGTDPDGTISAYRWRKVSGPTTFTITNTITAATTATGLVQGVYNFELRVTDNNGATGFDTMQVTVNPAPNQLPSANAGLDQSITLPVNSVSLTGSGTDPDGTIAAYLWTKISGPANGTINNPASAATTVTALVEGVYRLELKVTDNSGATDTDTIMVIVNPAPNQAPTAEAGLNQSITLPTNTVTLSGSGTDPDGTIVSYSWIKVSGPASGTITNASDATTTVTGLVQGVYQFEIIVTDNDGATDTDFIQVNVNAALPPPNQAPTAIAGLDQNITLPVNQVSLNGSGNDPDGIISAYRWRKISGPTTFTITNTITAATTATGLVQGVYRFELRVTDDSGANGFDTMQVTVNQAVNQLPTANAGLDQSIILPVNSVSLSGNGTDTDGTISAFLWTKISGPASGTISNITSAITSVTGLVEGVYKFELKVTDNRGGTDTDSMLVIVNPAPNQLPAAEAGLNQSITLPTNTVTLSGSGTDPDGTIVSYSWIKVSGPANGTITNATDATTTVTGLVQGVYQFELTVTDNDGATDTDIMQVNVNAALPPPNQSPSAIAGLDQNITLPINSVSLEGIGTDPDGTISAYRWRKISGPATFTITNTTTVRTTVTGLIQGVYQFELRVTDNNGATGFDTMQVTVNPAPNQLPTANAGLDQSITLPVNSVSLAGSGTDPDGTIAAYLWTKISGPANGTITNSTSAFTSVTGLVQGVYQFQLRVTDNNGAADTDTMQVTVNPAINQTPTAEAGLNQTITLPVNTVTLSGSGTDPDGTIVSYSWIKLSGPANGTITNASAATTTVTGLVQGVYQFEIIVTDNNGATDADVMQVNVNAALPPPNQAPTAIAGLDQNITLPINSVSLEGIGTDPDGTISTYRWRKVSGPASSNITNTTTATTTVTDLEQGIYQFELRVTDNNNATGFDTIKVTVNAAPPPPNQAPNAYAGADTIIYLPNNSVSLNGSGFDQDGFIVSYNWTIISGSAFLLNGATNAAAILSELQQGIYEAELTVTDNNGAISKDTVKIIVGAGRLTSIKDDVRIIGNPIQNTLVAEISSSTTNRLMKIVLYSINGALLYEKSLRLNQNVQLERIDMTKYSKGTYILQVYFDKKTPVVRKALKM